MEKEQRGGNKLLGCKTAIEQLEDLYVRGSLLGFIKADLRDSTAEKPHLAYEKVHLKIQR